MKSPFPGMDPYLVRHWQDVHASLVHNSRSTIQRQLPPALVARIGERLIVEENWEAERSILPDVSVIEHPRRGWGKAVVEAPAGVAIADPIIVTTPPLVRRETFVQIFDPASGGNVITFIEFISPTNKISREGRRQYVEKRDETLAAGISFVEIDLTRSGDWLFRFECKKLGEKGGFPYFASVWRGGENPNHHEVYPISLRERLPAIRIPLRMQDSDVILDLQDLIERAYEEGRYDVLDYSRPPNPPLAEEDQAWAAELLAAAKKPTSPSPEG